MPDDGRLVETVTTLYERLFRPDFERLRGEMRETAQSLRGEMGQMERRLRGEMRVMQADITALKQTTSEMQSDAADFHRDSDGHFDAVYHRFDRLETEYHMLIEGLRRVEQQVASDAGEREAIRAHIRGLEDGMADLRSRLSA